MSGSVKEIAIVVGSTGAMGQVITRRLADAGDDDETAPLVEPLTPREMQVLTLLTDGLPNKQIARDLGVSEETIKFHLASIFGKLGASNRTDAVRQALRRGLVPL